MSECVSVIIPTYNRGELVIGAIESALNQTYKDVEVIVSDDGSEKDVKSAVKSRFPDVVFIRHGHCGLPCSRNIAIKQSRCEYIAFLDDDDWWSEKFLEKTIERLRKGDVIGAFTNYYKVYESGVREAGYKTGKVPQIVDLSWIVRGSFIDPSTVVVRRDTIVKVGLFDESLLATEDWDMWIRMLRRGNFAYIDEKLAYKRIRVHVGIPIKSARTDTIVMDKLLSNISGEEYKRIKNNLNKSAARIYSKYAVFLLHEGEKDLAKKYFKKSLKFRFDVKAAYRYFLTFIPLPLVKILDGVYLRVVKSYFKSLKLEKR